MSHPEELLAEYVDGSLTQDERAAVDAHLAACEECRGDVEIARRARGALAELPELDPPSGFRPDLAIQRFRPSRQTGLRLRRAGIVTGAAAASIAAILAIALLGHGGGGELNGAAAPASLQPSGAAGIAAPTAPIAVRRSYTRHQVNELADAFASGRFERRVPPPFGQNAESASTPSAAGKHASDTAMASVPPTVCVRRAAGVPASAKKLHPIIAARFGGKPAYLAAFRVAGEVRVWVVSAADCSVLYTAVGHAG